MLKSLVRWLHNIKEGGQLRKRAEAGFNTKYPEHKGGILYSRVRQQNPNEAVVMIAFAPGDQPVSRKWWFVDKNDSYSEYELTESQVINTFGYQTIIH